MRYKEAADLKTKLSIREKQYNKANKKRKTFPQLLMILLKLPQILQVFHRKNYKKRAKNAGKFRKTFR